MTGLENNLETILRNCTKELENTEYFGNDCIMKHKDYLIQVRIDTGKTHGHYENVVLSIKSKQTGNLITSKVFNFSDYLINMDTSHPNYREGMKHEFLTYLNKKNGNWYLSKPTESSFDHIAMEIKRFIDTIFDESVN